MAQLINAVSSCRCFAVRGPSGPRTADTKGSRWSAHPSPIRRMRFPSDFGGEGLLNPVEVV